MQFLASHAVPRRQGLGGSLRNSKLRIQPQCDVTSLWEVDGMGRDMIIADALTRR